MAGPGDGDVRHSRPRAARRGTGRRGAARHRRPAALRVPRQLRLLGAVRLRGLTGPRHHPGEMQTVTVAERPELLERAWEETIGTIPEYNRHGDVINAYW